MSYVALGDIDKQTIIDVTKAITDRVLKKKMPLPGLTLDESRAYIHSTWPLAGANLDAKRALYEGRRHYAKLNERVNGQCYGKVYNYFTKTPGIKSIKCGDWFGLKDVAKSLICSDAANYIGAGAGGQAGAAGTGLLQGLICGGGGKPAPQPPPEQPKSMSMGMGTIAIVLGGALLLGQLLGGRK